MEPIRTLTANGNAGVGYEIPSYYGSALTFDGFGDYLSQTYDADFNFGTSDFTVEMWVYPNTVNSTDGLFAVSGGGGGVPKMVFHLTLEHHQFITMDLQEHQTYIQDLGYLYQRVSGLILHILVEGQLGIGILMEYQLELVVIAQI